MVDGKRKKVLENEKAALEGRGRGGGIGQKRASYAAGGPASRFGGFCRAPAVLSSAIVELSCRVGGRLATGAAEVKGAAERESRLGA